MKSHRVVCAPNTAFTCNLIELDEIFHFVRSANKQAVQERTDAMFLRLAKHSPHDSQTPVLKLCRHPLTRSLLCPSLNQLNPAGCFVILPPPHATATATAAEVSQDITNNAVFVWVGSRVLSAATIQVAVKLARDLLGVFTTANSIRLVRQGLEPPSLVSLLSSAAKHCQQKDQTVDFDDLWIESEQTQLASASLDISNTTNSMGNLSLLAVSSALLMESPESNLEENILALAMSPFAPSATTNDDDFDDEEDDGGGEDEDDEQQLVNNSLNFIGRRSFEAASTVTAGFNLNLASSTKFQGSCLGNSQRALELGSGRTKRALEGSSEDFTQIEQVLAKSKPQLFQAVESSSGDYRYEWESLGVYDEEDLLEVCVMEMVGFRFYSFFLILFFVFVICFPPPPTFFSLCVFSLCSSVCYT